MACFGAGSHNRSAEEIFLILSFLFRSHLCWRGGINSKISRGSWDRHFCDTTRQFNDLHDCSVILQQQQHCRKPNGVPLLSKALAYIALVSLFFSCYEMSLWSWALVPRLKWHLLKPGRGWNWFPCVTFALESVSANGIAQRNNPIKNHATSFGEKLTIDFSSLNSIVSPQIEDEDREQVYASLVTWVLCKVRRFSAIFAPW